MLRTRIICTFFICAFCSILQSHVYATPVDNYIGVVLAADKRRVGQEFVFSNLRSTRPNVAFPGGRPEETNKVFEDEQTIVLIYVASLTGSTETFYLNKKRRRFTLIEVGALEATVTDKDYRPVITQGNLR